MVPKSSDEIRGPQPLKMASDEYDRRPQSRPAPNKGIECNS